MRGIRSNDKYSVGSSWVNMAEQLSTQEIADHWGQEGTREDISSHILSFDNNHALLRKTFPVD